MQTSRIVTRGRRPLSFVCEECKLRAIAIPIFPRRRSFGTIPPPSAAPSSSPSPSTTQHRSTAGKPLPKTWFAYNPHLSAATAKSELHTSSSSSSPPSPPTSSLQLPASKHTGAHEGLAATLSFSTPDGKSTERNPVDERTVNLGRTIDILQSRIPTLLQSPLPSDILSPSITLHLFPTTHPNLPSISGRVGYIAALWSAPVAWGRLPGKKVRLEVLSERVIGSGVKGQEKLYVKWRTCSANGNNGNGDEKTNAAGGSSSNQNDGGNISQENGNNGDEFSGVFVFEFDDKGRIQKHTIENVDSGSNHEHSRVISVTEWLMRKVKTQPEDKAVPGLAFERARAPPERRKRGNPAASLRET